jgi:16S rRNA (adenine1518-N6/adenine1519-N6)-dimethyltransferase
MDKNHRAKKSLGQNFLKSNKYLSVIVDVAQIEKQDAVLEIGPGRGALTTKLLEKSNNVIAVEKDDLLIPLLKESFKKEITEGKLTLVHEDILNITPESLSLPKEYKLVANIPYYITGAILRMFLSAKNPPKTMVLMLQKEVARRIIARDKKESLLSLSVKAYGMPRYVDTVKAMYFSPKPNVDSAILLIENISKSFFNNFNEDKFFSIIKAGFAHKRKILSKNLESVFEKTKIIQAFLDCEIDIKSRAEDIALDKWKNLAEKL